MATIKKACKGGLYPKSSSVSSRMGSYGKKMKDGGSLGMKSVKAGYDKNPGVTRADIIVAAKKKAKSGTKMKKAIFGIGLSKEERMARREERQMKRKCRGGICGGRAKGFVGYKKGGSVKKTMKSGGSMKKCKYGCK